MPNTMAVGKSRDYVLTQIEQKTSIRFERYFNATLVAQAEMLNAVKNRVTDAAVIWAGQFPTQLPLEGVSTLPGLGTDLWVRLNAFWDLYQQSPEIRAELAQYNAVPIAPAGGTTYNLITKKPVRSLEDLKGLKIRGTGGQATLLKLLGAVPVNIAPPEIAQSIQQGVLDGCALPPSAIIGYGIHDAAKYFLNVDLGVGGAFIAVGKDVWNSFPAADQSTILQLATQTTEGAHRIYQIEGEENGIEVMRKAGVEINTPSAEFQAAVTKITQEQMWTPWVNDLEAKGLPARKILEQYQSLVNKYEAVNPFAKK